MADAQIPDRMQPPPAVVLPPPMNSADVLASVDKCAKQSKSHTVVMYTMLCSMGIALVVAIFVGVAQLLGKDVSWSDASIYIVGLTGVVSSVSAVAGWQRASDSKVRAEALKRG